MRLLLTALLLAATTAAPEGRWLTQDGDGVIEISACGAQLCGRIVGMAEPRRADGTPAVDHAGRPMCGLEILRVSAERPGEWSGRITDPDSGTDWNCTLRLDADGTLKLRGYVLLPLLGQTQTWTRYNGPLEPDCAMPSG